MNRLEKRAVLNKYASAAKAELLKRFMYKQAAPPNYGTTPNYNTNSGGTGTLGGQMSAKPTSSSSASLKTTPITVSNTPLLGVNSNGSLPSTGISQPQPNLPGLDTSGIPRSNQEVRQDMQRQQDQNIMRNLARRYGYTSLNEVPPQDRPYLAPTATPTTFSMLEDMDGNTRASMYTGQPHNLQWVGDAGERRGDANYNTYRTYHNGRLTEDDLF